MKTVFGKTILKDNQLKRPAPKKIGGYYVSTFNSSDIDSLKTSMSRVGCNESESKQVIKEFSKEMFLGKRSFESFADDESFNKPSKERKTMNIRKFKHITNIMLKSGVSSLSLAIIVQECADNLKTSTAGK